MQTSGYDLYVLKNSSVGYTFGDDKDITGVGIS